MDGSQADQNRTRNTIRFRCSFCGQKIRVPTRLAGKRGKCPKCKNVVIIPEVTPEPNEPHADGPIRLRRPHDGLNPPEAPAPRNLKSNLAEDPDAEDEPHDFAPRARPPIQPEQPDAAYIPGWTAPQPETPEQSGVPWFINMFAYPLSVGGIIHFLIFWLTPILLGVLGPYLFFMCCYSQLLALAIYILLGGYMLYYFFNCVTESAKGHRRAPDVSMQDPPAPGELVRKVLLVLTCNIVCFAPLTVYVIWFFWTRFQISDGADMSQFHLTGEIGFWVLYGAGIFLFPMLLLAMAMFDSLSALNPALIIPSISSTFLPYCGLVLIFYGIGYAINRIPPAARGYGAVYWALQIYAMFISFHLLGLFYRRYENKLNWDIKL